MPVSSYLLEMFLGTADLPLGHVSTDPVPHHVHDVEPPGGRGGVILDVPDEVEDGRAGDDGAALLVLVTVEQRVRVHGGRGHAARHLHHHGDQHQAQADSHTTAGEGRHCPSESGHLVLNKFLK